MYVCVVWCIYGMVYIWYGVCEDEEWSNEEGDNTNEEENIAKSTKATSPEPYSEKFNTNLSFDRQEDVNVGEIIRYICICSDLKYKVSERGILIYDR